jgi:hypothetical protein
MCHYHIFAFLILKLLNNSVIGIIGNALEPLEILLAIIDIVGKALSQDTPELDVE